EQALVELARGILPAGTGCHVGIVVAERAREVLEAVLVGKQQLVDASEAGVDAVPVEIDVRGAEVILEDLGPVRRERGALHVESGADAGRAEAARRKVVAVPDLSVGSLALWIGQLQVRRQTADDVGIRV